MMILFLIDVEEVKDFARRNKKESSKKSNYGYLNKYHN